MEKFKLGLIGCGGMMSQHLRGVDMLPMVEIVSVCDIIPERAQRVADSLENSPKVYTNYCDMVDDVDGVLVALPHDLHFACGMFFAEHNKHILMEKPMCNSERECLRLIEACEERNLTLMCAYPVPYLVGIEKLKEYLDSGDFGKIIQMSVWTEQLTGADGKFGTPEDWGMTARLGGGQLFSHGCHYIDLLLHFLGNPTWGAHVGTNVGTPWMDREGTSAVVMKFENGAVGYHGATWGARGTRMGYDFQVQTEKGMLEYDHTGGEIRYYSDSPIHIPGHETEPGKFQVLVSNIDNSKQTHREIIHFVDCVRTGKEPLTSGRKALQSLRVIWKLYQAEDTNTLADLHGLGLENA